jgi:hypothetical protein
VLVCEHTITQEGDTYTLVRHVPVVPGGPGHETCDANCPAVALVYVELHGLDLALCGHCFDDRIADLFAAGFQVRADYRPAVRAQEDKRR